MKTEQLTLEYLDFMSAPCNFKSFKVKLKEAASPKIKLRKTATYTVQSVQKPSKVFKNYQLHIGRNWYNAEMFRLVSEQEEQDWIIDPSKVNFYENEGRMFELTMEGGNIDRGVVNKKGSSFAAHDFDTKKLWRFYLTDDGTIDWKCYNRIPFKFRWISEKPTQPDHSVTDQFQPEPIHPDNQTVSTLVQYVSEHKDSMSKDSIRHFANLIGLIKLGAL
jgi:hypothetical protein